VVAASFTVGLRTVGLRGREGAGFSAA
jgi:hypothetical protein